MRAASPIDLTTGLFAPAIVGLALSLFASSLSVAPVWAEESADDGKLQTSLHAALKAANPDYQNGGTFTIKEGKLVAINLMRCKGITDLKPLSRFDLSSVASVSLYNAVNIVDLSPLSGCQLTRLNLERCGKIKDLSPLKGMSITWFRMYACSSVKDLTPLKGMPLDHLDIGLNPRVQDLSPLADMPLEDLRIDNCPQITSIAVLKNMPLKFLSLFGCKKIKDYSALGTLKLETLYFSPDLMSPEEIRMVKSMPSLKKIGTSWADYRKELPPDQFWKRFDKGEFKKVSTP